MSSSAPRSHATDSDWTGIRVPSGALGARSSHQVVCSVPKGSNSSTSTPFSTPTKTSHHPCARRSTRATGMLSSNSLANTTTMSALSSTNFGIRPRLRTESGWLCRCGSEVSTRVIDKAARQSGSDLKMDLARVPGPAPTSTRCNRVGSPASRHHASRARPTTAPNSGPTSGLVMKSRRLPAPWPVE